MKIYLSAGASTIAALMIIDRENATQAASAAPPIVSTLEARRMVEPDDKLHHIRRTCDGPS